MNKFQQITRADERMHSNHGWLKSHHSFSFAGHHDPERMGFGPLRVVNDDVVAPGGGFPSHPHRDMEIISLVLEGQLGHKDSLGNGRLLKAGDIQYMSAGSGVVHSEFNPSADEPVHFMQIWIEPQERGLTPRYADRTILGSDDNAWHCLLSPDGHGGSIAIRQDAELRSVHLKHGASIDYGTTRAGRGLWLFVIAGEIEVAGEQLGAGDSLALGGFPMLTLSQASGGSSEVLLFDLPIDNR